MLWSNPGSFSMVLADIFCFSPGATVQCVVASPWPTGFSHARKHVLENGGIKISWWKGLASILSQVEISILVNSQQQAFGLRLAAVNLGA